MPYYYAWRIILDEPGSPAAKLLSSLFDHSHLSLFGFSKLHQAYLGLSGDDFLTILDSIERTEVNVKDGFSQTTISWATKRGDRDTVRRLLACGADPNIPNFGDTTPLHLAAQFSTDEGCIGQLIEAKARVNIRNHYGKNS